MNEKLILDITIKEAENITNLKMPVELFKYAQINSKLAFLLGKKKRKLLDLILLLLNHATVGILIEVEETNTYVKLEVIAYED